MSARTITISPHARASPAAHDQWRDGFEAQECNLRCSYCFFLSKEGLYPDGESPLMSEQVLEIYIRDLMEAAPGPTVEVAWQGGEPLLRGLDFYRRSVELAEQYRKPHQRVTHTIQTNGTLIDDEWAAFFKRNNGRPEPRWTARGARRVPGRQQR